MRQGPRLGDRVDALARATQTATPTSPQNGSGTPEHRDLTNRGMRQQLLLDLARIDVRAAGDVHVGRAAGDVDEALLIDVAEVAGPEPAVAERLRIGLGIVVVAGEYAGTDHADLTGLVRFQLAAVVTLDRDLHAGTLEAAGADPRVRAVLESCSPAAAR